MYRYSPVKGRLVVEVVEELFVLRFHPCSVEVPQVERVEESNRM